jgi:hypothetical protein
VVSNHPEDVVRLPPEVESQLDERLAVWANARRLGSDDLAAIRGLVLARVSERVSAELDSEPGLDSEWLWSLLRPVTALIEWTADVGGGNLSDRLEGWLQPLTGEHAYRPYLRLA